MADNFGNEQRQLFEDVKLYKEKLDIEVKRDAKKVKAVEDKKKMSAFISDYVKEVTELYGELKDGFDNPMKVLAILQSVDGLKESLKANKKTFMGYRSFWQKLSGSTGEYAKLEGMLKPAQKAIGKYMAENYDEFNNYFSELKKQAGKQSAKYLPQVEAYRKEKLLEVQKSMKK